VDRNKNEMQIAFGVILGIAVGLFIDSIILLKFGGWMLVFVFPVILPVLLSALFFGLLGWKRALFNPPQAAILLMIAIGWPLCLMGPIFISQASLISEAGMYIPLYPDSEKKATRVAAIAGDGKPHIELAYSVRAPYSIVVDYYLRELPAKGWVITNNVSQSHPKGKELIKGRQIRAVKKDDNKYASVTVKDGDPVSIGVYYRK